MYVHFISYTVEIIHIKSLTRLQIKLILTYWVILVCWPGHGKKAITALIACVAILSKTSNA